jgi:ABC transport system ATP-binding/permease protein
MNAMHVDDAPAFATIMDEPLVIGRSDDATLRLLHRTVSRRHATVTRTSDGLMILDHDSRFGTFVNGTKVRSTRIQPGDRVQFGAATAYRVQANGLMLDVAAEGLSLDVESLAVSVSRRKPLNASLADRLQPGFATDAVGSQQRERKRLIEDVSFRVRPDSFVGILGPSGAGKSTLLNCLASYLVPNRGRLVFDDGRDACEEQAAYRALLGHVSQDDVVFRSLTVRENLTFAARLRLDGQSDVAAVVAETMERVGLTKHANASAAALSGGERKRLSVAVELLRRPRLLLLDEPTAGLDPASEAHLMEQFRQVTRRGTTVVCTTHLMDSLGLFDEVIVLGVVDHVGRIAYTGPPDGMLPHFGCRGFADLYEVLESGRFTPRMEPRENGVPGRNDDGRTDSATTPSSQRAGIGRLAATALAGSAWSQYLTVASRALRLVLRDRGLLLMVLAQPILLGLLVSLTQFDAEKIVPLFFFVVVIAVWLGLNNSARDLVKERRHYVRDRLAGLDFVAYLAAKTTVHVIVGVAQVLLLLAVLRLSRDFCLQDIVARDLQKTSSTGLFALLLICYVGGVGLGFLVSALVPTEETAVACLPLLVIPQLLLSVVATGVYSKRDDEQRPFRPLVAMINERQTLDSPAAVIIDLASMACLSRPGTLVAESLAKGGYRGKWTWIADFCHLVILVLAPWTLVFLAFQWAERRWLRLIGLG